MLLRLPAILGAALVLAQCASGPALDRWAELSPDDEVVVVYRQSGDREKGTPELRQTLVTDAVVTARALYSSEDSDPLMKVAPLPSMQLLLDGLATAGFFERARTEPIAGSSSVVVQLRDRTFAVSRHRGMTAEEFETYRQALVMFQNVYNGTEAFHVGPGDARMFEAEQERLSRQRQERMNERLRKGDT